MYYRKDFFALQYFVEKGTSHLTSCFLICTFGADSSIFIPLLASALLRHQLSAPQATQKNEQAVEVVETTKAPATTAAPVVASMPEMDLMASAVTGIEVAKHSRKTLLDIFERPWTRTMLCLTLKKNAIWSVYDTF